MNRTDAIRTATLIALPFLLLPASIWLWHIMVVTNFHALEWYYYYVGRWSLRAIYIGGAYLGWRAGRPHWFYPWLGFAVYEAAATLFLLGYIIVEGVVSRYYYAATDYLPWALFPLAFAPYFAVALWIGWRRSQRLLAAYAVFPHAALTFPLIFFFDLWAIFYDAWIEALLPAVAAAVCAVLFWLLPSIVLRGKENWTRAAVLFGGVLLSQLFNLIGTGISDPGYTIVTLDLLIWLTSLGWLILCGPLLLPPLIRWLIRLLKALRAIATL